MAAMYRLTTPHFVNNVYLDAGTIVTEGKELPLGWPPTLGADPMNSEAILAFWNAGPRDAISANSPLTDGSPSWGRWVGTQVSPPVVRWFRDANGHMVLTGAGGSLGPKPGW